LRPVYLGQISNGGKADESVKSSPIDYILLRRIASDNPHFHQTFANLKNAITGTYHAFDFEKYAHRYLGKFQYRFNRRFDLADMFKRLVKATAKADKVPNRNLRLAEDFLS